MVHCPLLSFSGFFGLVTPSVSIFKVSSSLEQNSCFIHINHTVLSAVCSHDTSTAAVLKYTHCGQQYAVTTVWPEDTLSLETHLYLVSPNILNHRYLFPTPPAICGAQSSYSLTIFLNPNRVLETRSTCGNFETWTLSSSSVSLNPFRLYQSRMCFNKVKSLDPITHRPYIACAHYRKLTVQYT